MTNPNESPSYRAAMVDSGRGHLLPDPHPGSAPSSLPWHRSFCNPCRVAAGLGALERNERPCRDHRPTWSPYDEHTEFHRATPDAGCPYCQENDQ